MTDVQERFRTDLTRRRFLQGSALAGTAAFLAASLHTMARWLTGREHTRP